MTAAFDPIKLNDMFPVKYSWLQNEPAPKMLLEALKLYGVKETVGAQDNPIILSWAEEIGITNYTHDAIAWCGLFIGVVAQRAGKPVVKDPLWAANWLNFGDEADVPMLGDVLVFKRPGGNHVGLYVGEDRTTYHVLGGNQSDAVGFTRIAKERLRGARRLYNIKPANVRIVKLEAGGDVSTNEA